jgi:hypothetical protein
MLATFGLERLESGITDDTTDEVAKLIEAAAPRPDADRRFIRRADPEFPSVPPLRTTFKALDDEPGLPTRRYGRADANPQFQATPHANRV